MAHPPRVRQPRVRVKPCMDEKRHSPSGHFLYPERGQGQKFFEPLPNIVYLVIEWTLMDPKYQNFCPKLKIIVFCGHTLQ